jgi:hypothetical protein
MSAIQAVAASSAIAGEVGLATSTGGYFGRYAAGLSLESESRSHLLTLTVGTTPDELAGDVRQFNVAYTYSPFKIGSVIQWIPLGIGIFGLWTNHEDFFVQGSDKYAEVQYDQTAIRPGLMVSSRWSMGRKDLFRFTPGLFASLLDLGVVHLYNNGWTKQFGDYTSLGFNATFDF